MTDLLLGPYSPTLDAHTWDLLCVDAPYSATHAAALRRLSGVHGPVEQMGLL